MVKKSSAKKGGKASRKPNPYGRGKPADEKTVLAGMSSLSDKLTKEFDQTNDHYSKHNLIQRKFMEKMINQTGIDVSDIVEAASQEQLSRTESLKNLQPRSPPQSLKVSPSSFNGSLHVTRTPPYEYQWTWSAKRNKAKIQTLSADKRNGHLRHQLDTDRDDYSSASSVAAVGISFRPFSRIGIGTLVVSATPSLDVYALASTAFSSADTNGWIGLYVGCYNLDGSFVVSAVDQKVSLYNMHATWLDVLESDFDNSGYPLQTVIPVDDYHIYTVWVWCGNHVRASGMDAFSNSSAFSLLSVDVPSISLSFFG